MINSRTFRIIKLFYLVFSICMTLMTNACMKKPMFICHLNYFDVEGEEAIRKEIVRLEKAIGQGPENSGKTAAYFQLALLYSHYKNPTPNYPRALSMFEKCLVSDPDSLKNEEVLYMKTLVRELVETDKKQVRMANKMAQLQQNNKKLKDTNAGIVKENKILQDSIEKLKLLELMLEEKRLNLR